MGRPRPAASVASQPPLATKGAMLMIPNRHQLTLDPAERLAESADHHRMREAARATGNWSVLNILAALADEARRRKSLKNGKRP